MKKKKFKRVLLCALFISLPILSNVKYNNLYYDNNKIEMCYINDSILLAQTIKIQNELKKDSVKYMLINEVENYILNTAPKANKNIPIYLVENALNYNIDLAFMLAQTQIETNFGTTGAGRESSRKSLFGVAIKKYNDYELAISDYCEILLKRYLINGTTEQHLLENYITYSGQRYASSPTYEIALKSNYNRIVRNTNIKDLQIKYNSL